MGWSLQGETQRQRLPLVTPVPLTQLSKGLADCDTSAVGDRHTSKVHLGNADNHGNQESGGVILGVPRGPPLDQVEWQWSKSSVDRVRGPSYRSTECTNFFVSTCTRQWEFIW